MSLRASRRLILPKLGDKHGSQRQAMKAARDCEKAEIFIKTMKKQKPNSQATYRRRDKSNVPPIGEAVAWLRREKDVFKRCLDLVKAHPVLIYDDSMDCLWEFLEPILKECARDQGKKHITSPKQAFVEGQLLDSDTKDRLKPHNNHDHCPPSPSPSRLSPAPPTRIPVRSPKPGHRSHKPESPASGRNESPLNTQPVLPPIGKRMGRRSSSTSELAKLGKISEGEAMPHTIDQFNESPFIRSQIKLPKASSAEDIRDIAPDEYIKTRYVVYKGDEPPQVVHFPEKADIRRDSIFKYLDSDTDSITLPLDSTFSDIDDRRLSISSEISLGF